MSAALLKKDGHEVTGVFIRIALDGYPCTAGTDRIDAMRVAAHLRIPFKEIDLSAEYAKRVFAESIKEFKRGRTPNPDALCNREIKFGLFYDWCMGQGADAVATGHYAQTKDGRLFAGADPAKDQSYFLALVPKEKLQKTLFPIGHLQKSQVRALAKKFGLPNAERPDSQGLCFLGPVSVGDMLKHELVVAPGEVLDEEGVVVGTHEGAPLYTLGQRQGFTLFVHSPTSVPHYVIAKDPEFNTITVSPNKFPTNATKTEVEFVEPNWISAAPQGRLWARYRYRQPLIAAKVSGNTVVLHEPHYVPEGQVLALYVDDECIGGAVIQKSRVY